MSKLSAGYDRLKTLYKNNLWQGRLILAVLITMLVLAVVRVSLPYTIIYSVSYWLNKQGVATNIEDISINIRKGTFTLTGASGTRAGDRLFNIGRASIDWDWRPLSKKTIHITSVELEDFNLDTKQYTDAMVVAGIVIRQGEDTEEAPAPEDDSVAWDASLRQIDFRDLGFCFQQYDLPYDQREQATPLIDYCGSVENLSWQGDFDLDSTDAAAEKSAQRIIVDATLQINALQLFNNRIDGALIDIGGMSLKKIRINDINDIRLDAIKLEQLSLLQHSGHSKHKHALDINKLEINEVSVNNMDAVNINTIVLEKPLISMARDESGKFAYEQWLLPPQSKQAETTQPSVAKNTDSNSVNIKLGDISVIDPELCYEQKPVESPEKIEPLDYCLNLANSNWQGDIAVSAGGQTEDVIISINGDLAFSGLITTNNLLNRDLVTFENLAISQLGINGFNNVVFKKLDMDNLAGLELTDAEGKHTITVASVDVSDFSYRDNALGIERVSVNDLGLEITQNQDGSLELDKWRIATTEQPDEKTNTGTGPDTEPLKIKIGEFNLDSKRVVEFTDMSVTPKMQVGLNELHINIKNLDSEKPEQKSPLELRARTLKHGTIDINGVAMPFESMPSFDATGKITGLDLRVASPKAEQAIGHIIKSGQMDADLKLLSDKGQLDSSISLVLYHFNLKAKSKEDAAELDKKFGMPINQSLMLLKDKKDRIKLKIPITGDINNPEFDPTDAIIKATAKATTVTLVTFYTPYGLAYAGGNVLFNLATGMNFDPMVFDPGSSRLTSAHESQLSKLTELLTERPGIHLVLCGSTNLGDRDKLFSEIIDPKKAPPPPSAERLQQLKQLAMERQENVKNHLVTQGNIAHNRLILCEPEHSDQADAIAGVEISI